MEGKRTKGQTCFRRNHSTTDHIVTLGVIAEEYCNKRSGLFFCFVDFRKALDTMLRNNMWNGLEELKVPFELRVVTTRLYTKMSSPSLRIMRGGEHI